MALTAEKAQQVVDTYVNGFAEGDAEQILALFADDITVEDPIGSEIKRGIDEVREFYTGAVSMGIKLKLQGPVRVAPNELAFPFEVHAPTGKIEVIDTFRFNEEGKVNQMRAYWGDSNFTPA